MARDAATAPGRIMMAARSTPNLQQAPLPQQQQQQQQQQQNQSGPVNKPSIYSYLHTQSGLNFAPVAQSQGDASSPPPAPPVRDASSLKCIKYGPGHEKFPSWPVSAAADTPQSMRSAPGGGSHRSKSWTDHTNYPKEKGITYTRPYMKRPNPAFTQQLKTVMERCEKIPPEAFESRPEMLEDSQGRLYLPRVDREGKALGDNDYMVPSPPERDIASKPQLTQADLEEYARSYQDPPQLTQVDLEEYARSYQDPKPQPTHLTQADLEEYSRTYDEALRPQHQQQQSYAQSEGYHSYVSSTDSITTTPFLDRLRRDSEATSRPVAGSQSSWDDHPEHERDGSHAGRDSVVTTSSGSASSSETLKWHGSLSDVSVASSSCTHHGSASSTSSRQLIAHSSRVQTPQRHHSESVLYLGNTSQSSGWQARVQRNNHHNKLRLFPVNTYTVQPNEQQQQQQHQHPQQHHHHHQQQQQQQQQSQHQQQQQTTHRLHPISPQSQPALSVAERISELERQQTRYTYLDPDKRHRVSDPTLKAIQKKALLSFYERHHSTVTARSQAWRSEPQLAQPATTVAPCPQSPPPQPPPRPRANQSARRASSASDYAGGAWRELATSKETVNTENGNTREGPRHQHSSSCGSLSSDLLGPLIVGPSISVDDWVPERPPKKPHLRAAFPPPVPERLPSPDLPPPSPPTVLEDEVFASDEPLPPPPPELHSPDWSEKKLLQSQTEKGVTFQRQLSQDNATVQRHGEISIHKHSENNTERKLENGNSPHKEASSQRLCENNNSSPQYGSIIQRRLENNPSPQSVSDTSMQRALSNNRQADESQQKSNENSSFQLKHQRSNNISPHSPDSNHNIHRYLENGMPSRYLERGFSLPRQIEDSTSPQKRFESINSSQRHIEQRQRENGNNQKSELNSSLVQRSSGNEPNLQRYQNGTTQRHLENGIQKHQENGNTRHIENLKTVDINISMSRSVSNSVLIRKQECGPVNTTHSGNTPSYVVTSPAFRNMNDTFARTSAIRPLESHTCSPAGPLTRRTDNIRSSLRYPTQKLMVNGKLATPITDHSKMENPPDIVRMAERSNLRNGDTVLPPKGRLQNFSTTILNGDDEKPEESPRIPKSPPHAKFESEGNGKQKLDEEIGVICTSLNSRISPPPVAGASEGSTNNSQLAKKDQSSQDLQVSRSTLHNQQSTSKASYLAYRRDRDRGLPNFEGSYKRTMSPSGQENNTSPDNSATECERVPSTGSMIKPGEEEHRQPTSHQTQTVSAGEKKFVVLTSVIDCDSNKDNSARTSDEIKVKAEESQCKGTQSPSPEEPRKVSVDNIETETQCDIPESPVSTKSKFEDLCPSVDSCSPPQSPPPPPPTLKQRISPPPVMVESLQLVQRSEVVLRVNAATSDAASQTELDKEVLDTKPEVTASPLVRQKLQEEIECERLSLDLASHLPPSDKLQGLLVPAPEHKKPTDYVSGLFRLDVTPRPRVVKIEASAISTSPTITSKSSSTTTSTTNTNISTATIEPQSNAEEVKESGESTVSPLSANSAYFTTSESKAKFLTRYGRDMNQSEQLNGLHDNRDLQKKKEELMARLDRKLQVLRGEHLVVTEESRVNDELGESVAAQVARLARPHEASKYRLHVEEVGKITSLLLGLSGRLARAENALMDLPSHHSERKILESKRDKLKEQLEEAKKLKENIDRRSVCVSSILYKYFNSEEYADYDHFINMKAKLIMDSREIADKIKLGEEQLAALKETLTAPD